MNILDIYKVDLKKDVFLKAIEDFKNKNNDVCEIHKYYLPFLWEGGNFNTVKSRYQELKKVIKEAPFRSKARKDEVLKALTLHESFFDLVNVQTKENAKERAGNQTIFSIENYLKQIEDIKKQIKEKDFSPYKTKTVLKQGKTVNIPIKRNDDFIKANLGAVYIAMVTGRRKDEIFTTLDVMKFGKNVYYSGLLKKRDEQEERYPAYILDNDYKFLKECLKALREYYPEYNDNNHKGSVNPFIREVLQNEDISYKEIRDMYVSVATETIKPNNMSDEVFKSLILNHKNDINLGTHYDKTRGE